MVACQNREIVGWWIMRPNDEGCVCDLNEEKRKVGWGIGPVAYDPFWRDGGVLRRQEGVG